MGRIKDCKGCNAALRELWSELQRELIGGTRAKHHHDLKERRGKKNEASEDEIVAFFMPPWNGNVLALASVFQTTNRRYLERVTDAERWRGRWCWRRKKRRSDRYSCPRTGGDDSDRFTPLLFSSLSSVPPFSSVTVNLKTWIWWWYLVTTAMLNSLLWYFLPGWYVRGLCWPTWRGLYSSVPNLYLNCSDRGGSKKNKKTWGLWSEK